MYPKKGVEYDLMGFRVLGSRLLSRGSLAFSVGLVLGLGFRFHCPAEQFGNLFLTTPKAPCTSIYIYIYLFIYYIYIYIHT